MIIPVYGVRDEKAVAFNNIVLSQNDFVIERSFAETIVSGSDRVMSFSPRDFVLYRLGKFDTEKGVLIPETPIVRIIDGSEVLTKYGPRIEKE